jgi:cytochrome c553
MNSTTLAASIAVMVIGMQSAAAETPAADTTAGAALYAGSCAACHGRTGRGVSAYPSLQNKTVEELTDKLNLYRSGERIGPNSALMIPNARNLTDEEIAALSVFMAATFR